MTPFLQDPDVTLYHGDVLDVLRELPSESVDCAATSPPFYGLRDYGTGRWEGGDEGCNHLKSLIPRDASDPGIRRSTLEGGKGTTTVQAEASQFRDTCGKCGARRIDQQIGLESSPEEWRDRLVEVFRELRRVLVPTGTLWVECGDSYAGGGGYAGDQAPSNAARVAAGIGVGGQKVGPRTLSAKKSVGRLANVKPKDLIGAPFLLAFGLRDDGWWWRSTNIWAKPNCLPESVTDRPVVSHSYVFQFSKKARYFHDAEAVREPAEWAAWGKQTDLKRDKFGAGSSRGTALGFDTYGRDKIRELANGEGSKSLRSVWTIPTEGFPEAHFATWPTKLAERILLQACPESVCRVCGKARERVVERGELVGRTANDGRGYVLPKSHDATGHKPTETYRPNAHRETQTLGFTDCGHDSFRPGVILDPFVGSGTTCHVARKLGRRSVGIDLSAEYLELAARRLQQQSLFAEPAA